ncbi:MAG: sulfatase, partial [Opitutae bacterium]|nr:sulfatase [Opitutae bacterium]
KNTLVVWCTEFGRMPFLQGNGTGRDHNPDAFTCFFAGAGVKKGYSYGESDNFGFKSLKGRSSVYDFNATILHLMGLDHERLSYYHNGLERRLTNVHGHVIKQVLA